MSLSAARCKGCSQPLANPPYTKLQVPCAACGTAHSLAFSADGQAADFDANFSGQNLGHWFEGARLAMMRGPLGVAVGACERCHAPLTIPAGAPVYLACPHCELALGGPAGEVLFDHWTEPCASLESGPGTTLEFRLAFAEAELGESVGCAHCGGPTPAEDPSFVCRRCGANAWFTRTQKRVQFGVQITGTSRGRPYETFVHIAQGEAYLRGSARLDASVASSKSFTKMAGIGCLLILGLILLPSLLIYLFTAR